MANPDSHLNANRNLSSDVPEALESNTNLSPNQPHFDDRSEGIPQSGSSKRNDEDSSSSFIARSDVYLNQTIEIELVEVRKTFAWTFKVVMIAVFAAIILTELAMFSAAVSKNLTPTSTEKALVIQLIQVGFAMFLGAVCVFLGVMVSWLGITSVFAMGAKVRLASSEKTDISLRSAGPGIILLIGGMLLIGVSLFKPIRYQETIENSNTVIQPGSGP